ncbi:MAG: 6,7-dimethyl-8-ribityllumazine synthase [Polyangiales bacterium]
MSTSTVIEGDLCLRHAPRFALIQARFNHFIVDRLVEGAQTALHQHGVTASAVTVVRVPGAWELPLVCDKLAHSGHFAAIVALGAVIRGATPHFDVVVSEASKGMAAAMLKHGVPVAMGVLTCDSIEQAIERAGTKVGNKGYEAALAALEMVNLLEGLERQASGR